VSLRAPSWIDIFFVFLSAFIRVNLRLKLSFQIKRCGQIAKQINAEEEKSDLPSSQVIRRSRRFDKIEGRLPAGVVWRRKDKILFS